MADQQTTRIRPYAAGDHDQVMAIAPRLTEWVAAWRDPGRGLGYLTLETGAANHPPVASTPPWGTRKKTSA
jgi:hypothetical protein